MSDSRGDTGNDRYVPQRLFCWRSSCRRPAVGFFDLPLSLGAALCAEHVVSDLHRFQKPNSWRWLDESEAVVYALSGPHKSTVQA